MNNDLSQKVAYITGGSKGIGFGVAKTLLDNGMRVAISSRHLEAAQEAASDEVYYIVSDKCTECKGFHDEPQCAAVCPVDCCVDDEDIRETEEELLAKKAWLHQEG